MLLFGDESEALTHPYLAHVWAKKGADLRIPAPGQAAKVAMLGVLDWARRELMVHTSRTKRSSDFIALLEEVDPGGGRSALWAQARPHAQADRACARQRPHPHP